MKYKHIICDNFHTPTVNEAEDSEFYDPEYYHGEYSIKARKNYVLIKIDEASYKLEIDSNNNPISFSIPDNVWYDKYEREI